MADQSMLMNSEQPENGIGFPMQSANNMAFTNGQDMQQGKMLPNVNPFGYPMFGVGAPGDMSTAHLSNPGSQMLQGSGTAAGAGGSGVGGAGAPNAWPTGMGQQSMMMPQQHGGQAVPPFMMNRPSFPPPVGPMHMPPNMPGGIMPSANPQMNPSIGPMGMGSFPNFPAWPNGPQPHDPTTWGQSSTVGSNSPALKAAGMGLPPAASGNAMGASNSTMPTPSLPDLGGDVGLPPTEDKSRPSTAESGVRVNGEIPGTPAAAGHQGLPSHFNAMMTPGAQPSVGATTAAAAGGGASSDVSEQKMYPNRSLLGQDGMMNTNAGALAPAFAAGQHPSTVALTTQHATVPMHPDVHRHSMATANSPVVNPLMHPGMMYQNQMFPRMPMDNMLPQQPHPPPTQQLPHAASPFPGNAGTGLGTPSTPLPPAASSASAPAPTAASRDTGTPAGNSRCPKNISEVLQPLYELGDEPGRKEMLDKLVELSRDTGTPTLYVPTLSSDHTHVDLYRLYEVIKGMGGLCTVVRKKVWRRVIEGMGMPSPSNVSALASTLRTHYQKLLLPLECKEKGKDLTEETNKVDSLRRTRATQRHAAAQAAATRSSSSPRRVGSPETTSDNARSSTTTTATATTAADTNVTTTPGAAASTTASSNVKSTQQQQQQRHPESDQADGPGKLNPTSSDSSHANTTAPATAAPATTTTVSSGGGLGAGSAMMPGFSTAQPTPAGVTQPAWPNQPAMMQPPSFPPQQFPHDPMRSSLGLPNSDPMMSLSGGVGAPGMFPDPSTPMDGGMGLNHPRPGMPASAPMADPLAERNMLQYKQQVQQWKQQQQQQQLLLQRQQMMAEAAAKTPSSLPSIPSAMNNTGTPQSPRISGTLASDPANPAATPESPAAVFGSSRSHGSICQTPTTAMLQSNNVFSRLLSGTSVDGGLANVVPRPLSARAAAVAAAARKSSTSEAADSSTNVSTVEHAAPKSVKRKHLYASHLAQLLGTLPNLWRLHMCLKAGLVAESSQAMDILSIIVGDEHTLVLFQLSQQPTVLETILSHLATSLHAVFGGFNDISAICDGDAQRRFFPEDPSNKELQRIRDEEYDVIQLQATAPVEDDPCAMDWTQAQADADAEEELACLANELPDGLRHILYPLDFTASSPLPAPAKQTAEAMDVEEEVADSAGVACSTEGDPSSNSSSSSSVTASKASKFCPAWLRHGTTVESEACSVASRTPSDRLLALRAMCCSNFIRSLSFLAANERPMSRHYGLMTVIARVEALFQTEKLSSDSRSRIASAWWWPWLEIVRADLMVTLVNISGQVDLSCLPTKLVSLLLRGLCHWCVSTSSSARDPLPPASACPGLSLQRLALEALSKISIGLGNVECMMAALDEDNWHCLCGRLVQWLLEKRHSVQYELSLVLLCSLACNDAVSRHICQQHHCVVTLMMALLSETEHYLCTMSRGVATDSHTVASPDLLRRAATLLLILSRQRCNRQHFAHHQSHLLILAASPYFYPVIPAILVDLLFQIGLE
ncbi:AT-rich interactive domain-containing protein 1B-like isoform X2 [Sycon ciliatum]|uniref:AT-rich interactive domain-containing protein 1B-like isoform X2 n=1 Tax=Sycon ciliatum TaxID=27933 RepID=UPI0031F607DD